MDFQNKTLRKNPRVCWRSRSRLRRQLGWKERSCLMKSLEKLPIRIVCSRLDV